MVYPQYTKNIRVKSKPAVFADEAVLAERDRIEKLIDGNGRVLLRQSGTEPVIRVMIEAETEELCVEYANAIADKIVEGGHSVE